MRVSKALLGIAFVAACFTGAPNVGADDVPHARSGLTKTQLETIGFDQHLGGKMPLDAPFLDESGRKVVLGDTFGERPVVLISGVNEIPADATHTDLFISKVEGPMAMCEKIAAVLAQTGRPVE